MTCAGYRPAGRPPRSRTAFKRPLPLASANAGEGIVRWSLRVQVTQHERLDWPRGGRTWPGSATRLRLCVTG